jgi:multicomponent K+:H+ antiporter subunit F
MMMMLQLAIGFALVCVTLAILCCGLRLLIGPASHDRVLALDTLWMCCMQFAIVLGMLFGSMIYFDAALLIAMVGFVSTVAMSKFLMRGAIIE